MTHQETIRTEDNAYTVVFRPEPDGGYTVTVPSLRGCISHGKALDEARTNIMAAIEGYLEALHKDCFGAYG